MHRDMKGDLNIRLTEFVEHACHLRGEPIINLYDACRVWCGNAIRAERIFKSAVGCARHKSEDQDAGPARNGSSDELL